MSRQIFPENRIKEAMKVSRWYRPKVMAEGGEPRIEREWHLHEAEAFWPRPAGRLLPEDGHVVEELPPHPDDSVHSLLLSVEEPVRIERRLSHILCVLHRRSPNYTGYLTARDCPDLTFQHF